MTEDHDEAPLGLADLAPVEMPEGLFETMIAVAVDPATADVDPDLIPGPGEDGPVGDTEVDLADLDDSPHDAPIHHDGTPSTGGSGDNSDVADYVGIAYPAADSVDPVVDPAAYNDPLAGGPGEDPAVHGDIDHPDLGDGDPGTGDDTTLANPGV